jgi:hypothetical protein
MINSESQKDNNIQKPSDTDKSKRAEVRYHNHQVIAEAAARLFSQELELDTEIVVPLSGLQFNQQPDKDAQTPPNFYLGLKAENFEYMGRISGKVSLRIIKGEGEDAHTVAKRKIEIDTQPNPLVVAARLADLVKKEEVVVIASNVNVFIPEYESNGFGQGLLKETAELVKTGVDVFQLQDKKVIYAYTLDAASGVKTANADSEAENYRKNWSSVVSNNEEMGYSTDNVDHYIGQRFIQLNGRNRFSVKVYKDETVEPAVNNL